MKFSGVLSLYFRFRIGTDCGLLRSRVVQDLLEMMDRNSILAVVFVISVFVAGGSPRVLAAAGVEKDSPSPSPLPTVKGDGPKTNLSDLKPSPNLPKSDTNLTDSHKLNAGTPVDPPVLSNSSNSTLQSDGKSHKEKDKNGTKIPDVSHTSEGKGQEDEVCKVSTIKCKQGNLTACFQDSGQASKQLLLVKNVGENTLEVTISVPASAKIDTKQLTLLKHTHEKINVSVNDGENSEVVLSTGNEKCFLQLQQAHESASAPASAAADFFKRLPSYATRMTPIYGAYLFFLTALIIGGMWACCKFGKRGRRDGGGVPYQELEMGLPHSSSAVGVDSADGWDQGWDDDWEEKATSRMPEIRRAGNVSVNGLTSRLPNREGWDDDWDD